MPKDYLAILTRDKEELPLEAQTFYDRETAVAWVEKYARQKECQGIVYHELDWFNFTPGKEREKNREAEIREEKDVNKS